MWRWAIGLGAGLLLCAAGAAGAEAPAISYPDSLRTEWSVEPARAGRGHVVGYIHNRNIKDAANVQLRVDRSATSRTRCSRTTASPLPTPAR